MEQNKTLEFIKEAISLRMKQEAEKLIEQAKKDLESRTPEIIASVVVDVMQMVQFQTLTDRIVFEIKKH